MAAPSASLARRRRLLVLGAGFTAPLGMPLTADLLASVWAIARQRPWRRPDGSSAPAGMADWLVEVIDAYYPLAGIAHAGLQAGRVPAGVSLEELLSMAAARAAMGYDGPQDVDAQGTRFIDCMRGWLGEVVAGQQARALRQVPPHYRAFARLARDAVVVSFNWNTVLEHLWRCEGVPHVYGMEARGEETARLLKVHGSIDWFPLDAPAARRLQLQPLGPALPGIGRARDALAAYRQGLVPCLVVPSFDKALQLLPFERLWQLPWAGLQDGWDVAVIGYSLRPDDFHSRAVLYPPLVRQSRRGALRVKVVDSAATAQQRDQVRARYAGVEGCAFFDHGFTPEAVDFVFG